MTATVMAFDGTPLVYSVDGDDIAYLTDVSTATERNHVNNFAERTLWGRTSYVPTVGNRRSVASGTTLVVPGETPVTVAEHDTSRFSDGEYGVERYLI